MTPFVRHLTHAVKGLFNAVASRLDEWVGPSEGEVVFRCNICGLTTKVDRKRLTREDPTCRCGSSVRLRALIHLLTDGLFGTSLAIQDIPRRSDLVGVDMSGASVYADRLALRLGYTNTFLHKAPRLDITAPGEEWLSRCDFVISSDVLEHVAPPVRPAFGNLLRLLKPGGLLVLTVPWTKDGTTVEHFPELNDYCVERRDGERVLVNRDADGQVRQYRNLVFHGGEGETLEMRVFSQTGLLDELADAGFCDIRIHAEPCEAFGVFWEHPWSLPVTARRPTA